MQLSQLVLAAAVAVSPVAAVVGGNYAAPGQFPYVVSLQKPTHRCGGTLINSQQLLTAAWCVNGTDPADFTVRVGSIMNTSGGSLVNISNFIVNPDYQFFTELNAIAIVNLATPVEGIQFPSLPASSSSGAQVSGQVTLAGWGVLRPGSGMMTIDLRFVNVPVNDNSACQPRYGRPTAGSDQFCVGSFSDNDRRGACTGDQGGPVMQGNTLVGVIPLSDGCGMGPDVDIAVAPHMDWINQNLIQ